MSTADLEIRVVLHGGLGSASAPTPDDRMLAVGAGTSLAEALESIGVDRGLIGVASSGGRLIDPESPLVPDAVVDVYPIFGGG